MKRFLLFLAVIGAGSCVSSLREKRQTSATCLCVLYIECSKERIIDTSGSAFIMAKNQPESCTCPERCPDNHLCCILPPQQESEENPQGALSTTKENSSPAIPIPLKPHTHLGCGVKRTSGILPKTGVNPVTEEARFGEYPWMVALYENGNVFICGASLISVKTVLTAAHCVHKRYASEIRARAGEWDTSNTREPIAHQERQVKTIIIHGRFNPDNMYNDIAILKVNYPFRIGASVDTICLPQNSLFTSELTNCVATGWGKHSEDRNEAYRPVLKTMAMKIVGNTLCETSLRTSVLGPFFRLHRSFMCASAETQRDTCVGDGGGPLVCSQPSGDSNKMMQVGIISWGINCKADKPGMYSSLQYFHDWIIGQV